MSQQQQIGGSGTPMCAAGCGFFGSPATLGMCSVCYRRHCCTMAVGPGAATAFDHLVVARSTPAAAGPAASVCLSAPATAKGAVAAEAAAVSPPHAPEAAAKKKKEEATPGRCAACRKKVGLTGFVCRCGRTFCGSHRYAEEHGCSFDFKGASRDAIAVANPVIKAEKLAGKI